VWVACYVAKDSHERKEKSLIKQYMGIIRRWLWLLLLTTLLTSTVAYTVARQQPPGYTALARLIVGPGIDGINPDLNALRTGGQLMQTYAELVTTRPFLQGVIDQASLPLTTNQLERQINVRADETTQILNISVQDLEPERAVTIVNTIANMLVQMSPSGAAGSEQQIRIRMADRIAELEQDAIAIEANVKKLQADLEATTNPAVRAVLEEKLSQERTYLSQARQTLASFYNTLRDSFTNQVKIIELAAEADPIASNLSLTVLMAGLAGLILALVIIVAYEYFNNTIATAEDLALAVDIPLLGAIAKHKPLASVERTHPARQAVPDSLVPAALRPMYETRKNFVVQALPESRTTENYRMLGGKLLLSRYRAKQMDYREVADNQDEPLVATPHATVRYPLGSVVFSGVQINEDTSEIPANLAVILAQTGHRVILVDANLHQPTIAQKFGIDDVEGLTTVLMGRTKQAKLIPIDWAPNLFVLPSGPETSNPFELLVSTRMANLITELENQADIVLITASPLLSYADSLILASRVDGVIIVMRSGRANREVVRDIVASLHSLDAHIIGAILDYNHAARPSFFARQQGHPAEMETPSELAQKATHLLRSAKS
jgi:capsular exopolysaccharide synthesis family protein